MPDLAVEIERALARAGASGKRVAVVFEAEWCPDSRALRASMSAPLLAPILARGFEVVSADVGRRDRHVEVASGFGVDYARGIPTVVVLDSDGSVVEALRNGELRSARSMTLAEIASHFARWAPGRPAEPPR